MKTSFTIIFLLSLGFNLSLFAEPPGAGPGYLFSSFRGNGEDGLHLAASKDGLQWTALKDDQSFLTPAIGGKLMRDPCIITGPDGMFHLVWTTGWNDKGIGIAHSKDLIQWSEPQFVPVMEHEPSVRNCWAPEITWDPDGKQYIIYWASTIPGKFPETEKQADKGWNHRIYSTTTKDFQTYTQTQLFFAPDFNVIDSTIVPFRDHFLMIVKDETRYPPAKNLRVLSSDKVTGLWEKISPPFTESWVEGPTTLKIGNWFYVYYDEYTRHKFGAKRTKDFVKWEDVSEKLSFPKGVRHGTAFSVSSEVLEALQRQ